MPKKKENLELEELVLGTTSFFEPMTLSKIILDFDDKKLLNFPDFDKEQLIQIIKYLEKKKKLKKVTIDKEVGWVKVQPKRSWLKKLFS
jgi:hypothetical protein